MSIPGIFISHSHHDNEFCGRLYEYLREHLSSASIFYDESELHVGDEWARRIQAEVIARPLFIVVISHQSIGAEWVREETNLALSRAVKDKNRRVIPVQIASDIGQADIDRLAPLLTLRQVISLSEDAPASHWDNLLKVLRGELSGEAPYVDPALLESLERAREFAV